MKRRETGWLLIQTAPREPGYYRLVARIELGKLLWWEKAKPVGVSEWKSRGGFVEPTHWMPLPEPPKETQL